MTSFTPERDERGGIIGMRPKDATRFADTLAATMVAVGADESAEEAPAPTRPRYRPGRLELAGIVGGLILAAVLIGLLNTFFPAPPSRLTYPTAAAAQPTAAAPTRAPAPPAVQAAYDAPSGALLGTIPETVTLAYQHSAWPGWGGVAWQGGIVWVQTDRPLAGLPDLIEPTPAPAPPPVIVYDPPPDAAPLPPEPSTHAKRHDEVGPSGHVPTPSAR